MQLISPDIHNVGYMFRRFRVMIEKTVPRKEKIGPKNITSIYLYGAWFAL